MNDAISALRRTANASPASDSKQPPPQGEVVGDGIGELPPAPILSGDAWAILAEKDPLKLSDADLDKQIAFCRNHRRMMAEGLIKKGQKAPKKTPAKKAKKAAETEEEAA